MSSYATAPPADTVKIPVATDIPVAKPIGEHAAPALPALNEFLNDSNEDARRNAQSAIYDINRRLSSAEQDEGPESERGRRGCRRANVRLSNRIRK